MTIKKFQELTERDKLYLRDGDGFILAVGELQRRRAYGEYLKDKARYT